MLLPRHASGQFQQRCCKSRLRETLAQQGEAGGRVDEDVHPGVPDRTNVACGELYGDEDVVDCKDQLHDDQRTARSRVCGQSSRTHVVMRM